MSSANHTIFRPRLPRFSVVDPHGLEVQVVSAGENQFTTVDMIDFSRQGMRFNLDSELAEGTLVTIRLRLAGPSPQQWTFHGRICWIQSLEVGNRCYGCEFTDVVSWEQLGELMLNGILSQD